MKDKLKSLVLVVAFITAFAELVQGAENCTPEADVAFLMDSSGSISRSNYGKMKTFVARLAAQFRISPSGSRAAVVLYSTTASTVIRFGAYTSAETFETAVQRLRHERGYTRIDLALGTAYFDLFRTRVNTRFLVPKIAFVLTDGEQTTISGYTPLDRAALTLKNVGVRIIAIGIGSKVNKDELKQIASSDKDVIVTKSFNDLLPIVEPLTQSACEEIEEISNCDTPVDIAFLVDSSGSISRTNYLREKAFINAVAKSFGISKARSRAALVLFSNSASVKIRFTDHSSTRAFQEAVGRIPHERGFTRIDKALEVAANYVFPNARPDVQQIAMVITDGEQTQRPDTINLKEASEPLRKAGVQVLALGIGLGVNPNELRLMVEKDEDVLLAKSFKDVLVKVNSLIKSTCDLAEPEPCDIPADLAFIFGSGGISETDFIRQKVAVKTVAKAFGISSRRSQASIVTYGDYSASVDTSLGIESITSTDDFFKAVTSLKYGRARGDIRQALKLAEEKVFPKAREGVTKVAVIIVDEQQDKDRRWWTSVLSLRRADVRVVLVGVGPGFSHASLRPLMRNDTGIVIMESFAGLMRNAVELAKTTCHVAVLPPCQLAADVTLLIDSSKSEVNDYLLKQKSFVKIIMKSFAPNWRAAVVTYGKNATVKASLGQFPNLTDFEEAVNKIANDKGKNRSLRLDEAMDLAATKVFSEARPGVTKLALILTDGNTAAGSNALRVKQAFEASSKADIRVVTLGIGQGVDVQVWSDMVVYDQDLIHLTDPQDLTFKIHELATTICAAAEPIEKPSCRNVVDIAFLVDSSDNVNAEEFQKQKSLVISIARSFWFAPDYSRGALVLYSDRASVRFRFEDSVSTPSFVNAVRKMPLEKGGSRMDKAFDIAKDVFRSARVGVPSIAFVVSSGKQSPGSKPLSVASEPLREAHIKVVVLGVGREANLQELRSIVNNDEDVLRADSYDQLILDRKNMSRKLCLAAAPPPCKTLVDLAFIIDSSGSIGRTNYLKEKHFVKQLARSFGVAPGQSQAAMILYSNSATVYARFGQHATAEEFEQAVDALPYERGLTRIDKALLLAAAEIFPGARSGVPKIALLITDGKQTRAADAKGLKEASAPLRKAGVRVLAVGIGSGIDLDELRLVTEADENVVVAKNFPDLLVQLGNLTSKACQLSNIDYCAAQPCLNGATCNNDGADYTCVCAVGFTGKNCSIDIDDCAGQPCQNEGSCVDRVNDYTCICVDGYTGKNCSIDINDCTEQPCQNGGTCIDGVNEYSCNCVEGYTGKSCEEDINDCHVQPCLSGGTCLDGVNEYTCICAVGYTGKNCSIDIDDCVEEPCHHGGTCVDSVNGYTCNCAEGYTGKDCSIDIDDCVGQPCLNEGTCKDGANDYTCICTIGYTGKNCAIDIDDCVDQPCQNGGTCIDGVNDYTCNCADGYTGKNCAEDVDECAAQPCRNGGKCLDGVNEYTCICALGYTGKRCSIDMDDCAGQPCYNGGTCIDKVNDYICNCADGYTGKNCSIDIDDCVGEPCLNEGTCIDAVNDYSCTCAVGYTGKNCATDIDDCAGQPCLNGGTCIDRLNDYTCICAVGYHGKSCNSDIDDCASRPCLNGGSCNDRVNDYSCNCVDGYTGKNCKVDIDDCAALPCLNGGVCTDDVNDYTCVCAAGFTGKNCNININDCAGQPCHNGGTCIDSVNDYTCTCVDGFTGRNCSINVDDCAGQPCINGGTCSDEVNDYSCLCAIGYTGKNCSIDIDDCAAQPCLNGGTCSDRINDYSCTCSDGFTGTNCHLDIDDCADHPCLNGGNCTDLVNNYRCSCVNGYTGKNCSSDIDDCVNHPCNNGGTCVDSVNGYTCKCIDGYTGKNCNIATTKAVCSIPMDVVFLLDSSSNAGEVGYQTQKDFIRLFSNGIDVSPAGSRIGVVSYSSKARLYVALEDHDNRSGLQSAISDLKFLGGRTRIDTALKVTFDDLFTVTGGARPGVPRVAVLLTFGKERNNTDYETLRFAAEPFKGEGIPVIAVGIGPKADLQTLRVLVDDDELILAAESFERLSDLALNVTLLACKAAEPERVIHLMDVAFLIDTSAGVSDLSFQREKNFLKTLVRSLTISFNLGRVGIISYGNESHLTVNFSDQQTLDSLIESVDSIPFLGGGAHIDKALQMASEQLFSPPAPAHAAVPRSVIIVTDCESNPSNGPIRLDDSVDPLRKDGVKILVVAVGCESDDDIRGLETLVEGADDIFAADSFESLAAAASRVRAAASDFAAPAKCTKPADIAFIIQSSDTTGIENYQIQKDFIKAIAGSFGIQPDGSQAGVVISGNDTTVNIKFSDHLDDEDFKEAVDKLPYTQGHGTLDNALRVVLTKLFAAQGGARIGVAKILIVVSSAEKEPQALPEDLSAHAQKLRQLGVAVFVMGVGEQPNVNALTSLVNKKDHLFLEESFESLMLRTRQLANMTCDTAGFSRCTNPVDVAFLVDSSGSLNEKGFRKQKDFIRAIVENLYVSPSDSQIGIITYSDKASVAIKFSDYEYQEDLLSAVEGLQYKGKTTRIDRAIALATKELMTPEAGKRENIPGVMVILTDGRQTIDSDSTPLNDAVANLINMGVKTLVVGIGELADAKELRKMAVQEQDVFLVPSPHLLPNVALPIAAGICEAAAPQTCTVALDVVFVVESSDNISPTAFQRVKEFIKEVVKYLFTTGGEQQVALILYNSKATKEIAFGQYSSEFDLDEIISNLSHKKGEARLAEALQLAHKVFTDEGGARRGVQKVCIVLTNEKKAAYKESKALKKAAEPLHQAGVRVIAIGVTSSADGNKLRALTEGPKDVIKSHSCDSLQAKFSYLFKRICYGVAYRQCNGIADVIFAVHSPERLGPSNYRKEKEFVKSVATVLGIAPGKRQVALILYSNFATARAELGAKTTVKSFNNLVDGLPHEQGKTRIDRALKLARSLFDSSGTKRQGVPKILIVLTTDKQSAGPDAMSLADTARPLHETGVRIIMVGIGQTVDQSELRAVVLKEEDVLLAPSFDDLVSSSDSVSKVICEAAQPPICSAPMDVAFLVDSSGSVRKADFQKQKAFVKAAASTLDLDSGMANAGSLVYSDIATVHQAFDKCNGTRSVLEAIDRIPYYGRATRIDRALSLANTEMFSDSGGCRPYVAKTLVLLADGKQTEAPDSISMERAVKPLKTKKVARLAVGIGNQISASELRRVVDKEGDIITVDSFDHLLASLHLVSNKICASAALKKCAAPVDIAFLLDSSASIGEHGYQKMKEFVKAVANTFEIGPGRTCAGVIIYSTTATTAVRFPDASNNEVFNAAIDALPYLRGETRTDKALELAYHELLTHKGGARKGVAKVVIVLTNGRQSQLPDGDDLQTAVAPLLSAGIRVFAVGIGKEIEEKELLLMVDRKDDAILVPSYDGLIERVRQLSIATCESSEIDACDNTLDVAFILDSSGSLTPHEFQQSKDFIDILANSFLKNKVGSRVGLIQFSIVPKINARLSDDLTNEQFRSMLDDVNYQGGFTRLDRALSLAEKLFSDGKDSRKFIPKVLIVLSDGANTDAPDTLAFDTAVAPLHRAGVRVFVVATGNAKGREDLYLLTKRKEDLYDVGNYDNLPLQLRKILKDTCESGALPRCDRAMDVSFIVDSSESVGLQNYQKLLEFVRNIAKTLQMSPDESHASLVVFSNNARVQIKLDDHDDIRDFNKAVQDVPYMGKKTRIDKALRVASVGVFNSRAGMRPGLRRVAVLLTEGHQTKTFDSIPLKYAVEPLRRKRVDVFAVGIGSNVRYDELRSVTNSDQNVLLVKSFQGLAGIAEELSKKMCGG